MKEIEIEEYLLKQVRLHDGFCAKVMFPGIRGAPDRLVGLNGQMYFVELKSKAGLVSQHQRLLHITFLVYKHPVVVLRSKEAVDLWLKKILAVANTNASR